MQCSVQYPDSIRIQHKFPNPSRKVFKRLVYVESNVFVSLDTFEASFTLVDAWYIRNI